jgi:hypothetical protein
VAVLGCLALTVMIAKGVPRLADAASSPQPTTPPVASDELLRDRVSDRSCATPAGSEFCTVELLAKNALAETPSRRPL